jgi:hypothetical protein
VCSEETFVSVEHDLETLIVKVAVFIFNPMAKEKKTMATKITGGGIFFNARIGHNILSTPLIHQSGFVWLTVSFVWLP